MLPASILSEIMTYLSLPELLNASQVCKRFYYSSNVPCLYRREFLHIWTSLTDGPGQASDNWKSLCLSGSRVKQYWQNLSDYLFTRSEIKLLYEEVVNTLAFPTPVMPSFRRDVFSFPTLVQDLLANPSDQYLIDDEFEEYSNVISSYLQEFSEDLYYKTSSTDLACARWNAQRPKERDSIGSVSTQDSYENSESYLISLFKAIKKSIKVYCEGIAQVTLEASDVLDAYCNSWENYSFSIKKINSLFLPVTETINDFYDLCYPGKDCPRINFMKVMTGIWRKKVFDLCKEKLVIAVIQEYSYLKKNKYINGCNSKRLVESLLDISLNELTIFFKSHSLVNIEGSYNYLHLSILEYLKESYKTLDIDFSLEEDLLRYMFLPVTVREARRIYCEVVGNATGNEEFIKASQDFTKNEDDLMIEWRAKNIGIPTNFESEDLWKFSQCRDTKLIDILNHLQGYQECNML